MKQNSSVSLRQRFARSIQAIKPKARSRRVPLRLERLEDRCMLAGVDCDDHGDNITEATPLPTPVIAAPTLINGVWEIGGDHDAFAFTARAETTYEVRVVLDQAVGFGFGHSADFVRGSSGLGRSWRISVGTIDVEVPFTLHGHGNEGVDSPVGYSLSIVEVDLTDDHGNLPATATPITVPSATPGELETGGDVDVFSIEAEEGETYLFDIQSPVDSHIGQRNPPSGVSLHLFDVDGVTSFTLENGIEGGDATHLAWTAPADGTYFVEVINTSQEYREYVFEVGLIQDDHKAAIAQATQVDIPSATPGQFEFAGDIDLFSFQADAGINYNVSTSGDLNVCGDDVIRAGFFIGGTPHCAITIYDSERNQLASNYEGFGIDSVNVLPSIDWAASEDGTYFVEIKARNLAPGAYSLDIRAAGDLNQDGRVDSVDLGLLLNNFNDEIEGAGWGRGDINGDIVVDTVDLGLLLNNFVNDTQVAATVASGSHNQPRRRPLIDASRRADFSLGKDSTNKLVSAKQTLASQCNPASSLVMRPKR